LQIGAEQLVQVGEDGRGSGRVEPVAPVVDADTGHVEAGGHAADRLGAVQDGDAQPLAGGAPRGGQPGRASSEDEEIRHVPDPNLTCRPAS
jgi:hypothetical protein